MPAGTYAGGLSVAGKSLVIESDAGAAATVLDGGGQVGTVLSVTGGASLTLRGFTVRGGLGGTPVADEDGLVRLAGGGMLVRGASASLVECLVEGNLAGFGGGVAAVDASFEAVASEIRANHAAHDGGGLWSTGSVASLLGGSIRGNVAGAAGGGVHADADSALEAHATAICDNQPDEAQGDVRGKPGSCSACAADLDGDGVVGSGDLTVLFAAWGAVDLPFDLDGDGAVSGGDVSVVFAAWGTACGE